LGGWPTSHDYIDFARRHLARRVSPLTTHQSPSAPASIPSSPDAPPAAAKATAERPVPSAEALIAGGSRLTILLKLLV
jgi:hypothetical protein